MDLETLQSAQNLITPEKLGLSLTAIIIIALAVLILQGLALWKSSKNNQKVWFWALLIFNTLGILPIIYLIITRRR